jgi:ATP-dependent RNA helicase SUPV3L1/SUV3
VQIRTYERLSPLSVSDSMRGVSLREIQKGDCIIAFSRKDIYRLRSLVQNTTRHKCCVVYGLLPPETRSSQAQLFNDPESGVLGMGSELDWR